MAKLLILANVFAIADDTNPAQMNNQFLGKLDDKFAIVNVAESDANGNVTKYRILSKEVMQSLLNQGKLIGGSTEQKTTIVNRLASWGELEIYRDNATVTVKADYMPESTTINAAVKQKSPYAEPFTLLGVNQTANGVRQMVGLPFTFSGTEKEYIPTEPPKPESDTTFFKDFEDTFKMLGEGKLKEAFDKNPKTTTFLGVVALEGLSQVFTGKTVVVGSLMRKPTHLLGGKRRKKRR